MQAKTWLKKCISALIGAIVLFFMLCFVFDPYFHFHKPFSFVRYRLYDERYTNDGISRHFELPWRRILNPVKWINYLEHSL